MEVTVSGGEVTPSVTSETLQGQQISLKKVQTSSLTSDERLTVHLFAEGVGKSTAQDRDWETVTSI